MQGGRVLDPHRDAASRFLNVNERCHVGDAHRDMKAYIRIQGGYRRPDSGGMKFWLYEKPAVFQRLLSQRKAWSRRDEILALKVQSCSVFRADKPAEGVWGWNELMGLEL